MLGENNFNNYFSAVFRGYGADWQDEALWKKNLQLPFESNFEPFLSFV